MIKITLSRKLGELRMTQSQLAKMTGIRNATIFDLYHGYAERFSFDQMDRICKALHCPPWEIIEWIDDSDPEANIPNGVKQKNR